ncbi:hypothetical protein L1987_31434 [Smallanthus sonchifolius]|uniref:Uncharacterized protein n=1 Tax=Smallanthus sonchifolius TaxID=185202 RepID=A0ACB9I5K3_9ASTR|nr:hypothetical protein L1987_31434 [Smallanthus sonchifolius]
MSMDASFPNKRLFDHSAVDRSDPHLTSASSTKRRHQHHHPLPSSPVTPQSNINNPFRAPFKLSSGETLFRILCPASKTGGLIGKGGAIIRQFREETGAKIRIDEPIPGSEERVILIVAADSSPKNKDVVNNNEDCNSEESGSSNCEESPAQKALVRVFERILKVDEERSKLSKEESENVEDNSGEGSGGISQGPVVCRLLAASHQIGCVLGRGGKIIEKIRQESGAQVRVLPKDQIPDCAFPGDELIQMAGKFLAVKKALLSVSSCLQEAGNSGSNRPMGMVPHGHGGDHHRMGMEEEVVFRLLCHSDKVGSLIGKGGSIRRALQTETGASIKIADPTPDSDERVVVISARENLEQRHSPAQDAVMRVHSRIVEAGFEAGAAIVARVLVHSRQIGCLWGKGGMIISELRRVTGASIHIFPREQVAKYGMPSDEVVQVIGSLQSVQDALFQITGRLRETFFPMKPYFSNGYMGPPHLEMPPPSFRPRHDSAYSPVGPFEPPPFLHGGDHFHPSYSHPYGNERPGYGPPFSRQSEPGSNRYLGEVGDFEGSLAKVNDPAARNESIIVEMAVPQSLLGFVHGENNSNLGHIKEISGAKVAVTEGKSGVALSGTYDETQTAQCLIHAFILCEQQHLTSLGL